MKSAVIVGTPPKDSKIEMVRIYDFESHLTVSIYQSPGRSTTGLVVLVLGPPHCIHFVLDAKLFIPSLGQIQSPGRNFVDTPWPALIPTMPPPDGPAGLDPPRMPHRKHCRFRAKLWASHASQNQSPGFVGC